MTSFSNALVLKVLDGLDLRATATAANIANASTRNYRPLRVNFEDALAQSAARGPTSLANFHPRLEQAPPSAAAEGSRLDLEAATASATTLRYSALVEVLNRELQIDALAVSGSR